MKTALYAFCSLGLLAGVAWADPCRSRQGGGVGYSCATRSAAHAGPAYAPPAAYRPAYHDRDVIIADVYFPLYDYRAKDVFVFSGPPPAAAPGLFLGYDAKGVEARGVAPQVAPARVRLADAASRLLASEDAARDVSPRLVAGWESGPPPVTPAREGVRAALASLTASCASCHTAGSEKGGFVLFAAGGALASDVDWKAAKDAVSSGRMPKPGAGKPPVSETDKQEIARRAGG